MTDSTRNAIDTHRAIYKVINDNGVSVTPWVPTPLGPGMKKDFPEVVNWTRVLMGGQLTLKHENVVFNERIVSA